ncbi:hypothetical protein RQP46_001208 [Phenoliferia psychrophenolica]
MKEYSASLRIAQICFACLFCLLSAGVIFGYAALKPVLIQEGVYADLCSAGERVRDENGQWNDTRLNLMFTLATVVTNVVCLPVGYTLDRLDFDSYVIGYILLGVGGPLVFLPQFHLSNAFPAYSGVVLAALTGSFDASSIPFVLYRLAYNGSGGSFNLRIFFWGYLIVPVCIIIEQLTIAPRETYQRLAATATPSATEAATPPPPEPEAIDSALADTFSSFSRIHYGDAQDDDQEMIELVGPKDSLTGVLYGRTAREQILTKWFALLTLFVCVHMTRTNWYVQTVGSQLASYLGDAAQAERLTVWFTIILPLAGFVAVPFIGVLLDNRPVFDVFGVLAFMGAAFGILGMTTLAWTQMLGIVIFCLFRPLMYTATSDAFAKVFGFQTFGTVYGLAMTTSGLIGLINAPLDLFVKNTLHGNFIPIGTSLVVAGLLVCGSVMALIRGYTREGAVRLA